MSDDIVDKANIISGMNTPSYCIGRRVYGTVCDMIESIHQLEAQLQSVLDRETSIIRYYDAKLDAADAKLAKAMEVVELIASADVDAVLGQAVDLSCEIIGELMEDE